MKSKYIKMLTRLAGAVLAAAVVVSTAQADFISTMAGLGPVGWWRLTNSTATAPLFIVTNAGTLHSAANGYVVQTTSDTPLLGQPGQIGNSVRFSNPGNTVGLCDSKIEVPWQAGLNQNPPFSIEFWTMPNSLGADSTGFSPLENFNPSGNEGGSRRGWLFYINNSGRWNFRLGAYSGYTLSLLGTSGNAVAGSWQHMVVTWDGTNVIMYANGSVIASAATAIASDGWVPNAVSFLRMGGSPLTGNNAEYNGISGTSTIGNRGYDGWLQHVAIYSNVLSAATVSDHYSIGLLGNPATYQSHVLSNNPAGYWPLSDAAVATPATNAIADSGIDGTATGTVYPGVKVQSGPGYAGFGTDTNGLFVDGVNGYIQVADTADLNSGAIASTITLTAWVKPQAQDYFRDIIARGFDANSAETFLRVSRGPLFTGGFENYATDPSGDDGQYYEIGTSDGQNFYDSAQFQIPPGDIGQWVFLAGTCDGSNWNLYRDGQLVATVPVDTADGDTGPVMPTQQWTIGARAPDSVTAGTFDTSFLGQGENFDGTIFEPAIFNYALTPSQITNLYTSASVPPVFTLSLINPGTVSSHSSVSFYAYADGNPTITYLWYLNGVSTGNTTTNFNISNISAGSYTVAIVASNPFGNTTNSVSFAAVSQPPLVSVAPVTEERYVGYPFTLSVTASGTPPLTYFWTQNGTVVQAGSSSNYSVASPVVGNTGSYSVIVSNEADTSFNYTSTPVAVTIKAIPAGYPATIVSNSPQSYWRLDEASGTTAYDMISGNNGIYNSATLGLPGYSPLDSDKAAAFSGLNSYIGSINNIDYPGNVPFTLEAWVNGPSGLPDQATIIAKGIGNNGTTETEQFALDVSGGNYRFFTTHAGNKYQALAGSIGPDGTWQYVVGVYDTSTSPNPTLRLYVNGVQVASTTAPFAPSTTTTPVSIGSKRTGNDPGYDGTFVGTIDEVAVYPAALSASTVLEHYNAAYGTTLAPVITIQPVSTTNYNTLPVSLYVGAYGSATVNYQWYKGTPPGGTAVGVNSPVFTIASAASTDAGSYYCNISNPVLPGGTNTAVVSLVILPTPTSPPNISGLVVHLPFNGNLTDATGRGNNGTGIHVANPLLFPITNSIAASNAVTMTILSPSPATSPDFYYNSGPFAGSQALHYSTVAFNTGGLTANGTSVGTNDYYVTLGSRPDLQFSTNSFSVSYWIRLPVGFGESAPDGGDLPFFTDVTNSTGGWGYCFTLAYGYGTANPVPTTAPLFNEVGAFGISIYDAAGNGIRYYGDNSDSINDGNYHNLVQVVNRSTGQFTCYIDGVPAIQYLDAGTSLNPVGSIDNGAGATIGQDPTGLYGEDGSADIADLGVWRKALSPLEAASIYVAGTNNLSFTGTFIGYATSIKITSTSKSGSSVTLKWIPTPSIANSFSVLSTTNLGGGIWTTNVSGYSTTNYTDSAASSATKFYRVTSP